MYDKTQREYMVFRIDKLVLLVVVSFACMNLSDRRLFVIQVHKRLGTRLSCRVGKQGVSLGILNDNFYNTTTNTQLSVWFAFVRILNTVSR